MSDTPLFSDLQLSEPLLRVLNELGYETPSPIQAATIPLLLSNRDVLGQAQTGTGKTAAFALPILSRLDLRQTSPQALVLAPTRELALQVAEAFQRYATHIPGFHVLPIYGGQSYGPQLAALRRGVHVIVGTPGRIIDHIDKGSLDLSKIKTLVLDEADEMLRMGFVEEVENILKSTPATRQTALFSATMPAAIKRIAKTYLQEPELVTVAAKTGTADNIRQRYCLVSGMLKLDALTRILEAETFDGMIIFARTKLGTEELAGKLQARGFSAAAINGDLQQAQRERTIDQLKNGNIDILVATDVAARGLDVDRISHVINYDIPTDPESYTHRIGRTGRAGRSGEAILFITPRERGLLKMIERSTRQAVSQLELPSIEAVNNVRIARFKDQISATLAAGDLSFFQGLVEDYEREHDVPANTIAAALAKMVRGASALLLDKNSREAAPNAPMREASSARPARPARAERTENYERAPREFAKKERAPRPADPGMQSYRIEVGHAHGVKPGNIVGAIANETNTDAKQIGRIEIYDDFSVVDLPSSMPADLINHLKGVRVAGQMLRLSIDQPNAGNSHSAPAPRPARPEAAAPSAAKPERAERAPAKAAPTLGDWLDEPSEAPAAKPAAAKKIKGKLRADTSVFRIETGRSEALTPNTIVGVIAEGADLDPKLVGRIEIFDNYSLVELPQGMPREVLKHLNSVPLLGKTMRISEGGEMSPLPVSARTPGSKKSKKATSAPAEADSRPAAKPPKD